MTLSDFKRWLYRGQRPNWIARILNRAWAAVGSSGVASNVQLPRDIGSDRTKVGADDLCQWSWLSSMDRGI
jgi:hypothetical protein